MSGVNRKARLPLSRAFILTQPFSKASTKSQSRINPAISIINIITRGRKRNGHFAQSLQHSPDTRADEKISNDHVSRTASGQSSTGADEESRADVGPK